MARLAVVIVNHNGESTLPACVGALRQQSWDDFCLILVDNASGDGSVERAELDFPAVEIIRNPMNLGFAEGNNIGIRRALVDPGVEYVLTLNNDTIPASDFLEQLVAAAETSPPDYGSWQGKVVFADEPRLIDTVGIDLTNDSIAAQVGYRQIDVGQHTSGDVYGVNAAAALYSRRFIEDLMLDGEFFDRDFFAYLEDVDVAVRGIGAGWKAAYVSTAVVEHVGSATAGPESLFKWRLTSRNKLFLQFKNYAARDLRSNLLATIQGEIWVVLGFLRTPQRGMVRNYFASRARAVLGLPRMLPKRKAIRDRRVASTIFAPRRPVVSDSTAGVLLSVVIPTWNGRGLIEECLDALRAQTVEGIEIIVVDNGSHDGSVEFIRERYPEVIAISLPMNFGFATAVNIGITASNGRFVALINNDAIADPRWAAELLAAMEHGDIATSLMLLYDDPELVDSRGESLSTWGIPYRQGHGERVNGMSLDGYPEIFAASGGASIYKREVFARVGVFDPQYFAYLEDVDISFRARLAGYRIVLAPKATVRHKVGATAGTMGAFQLRQYIKNSHLLIWKNLPLRSLIRVLPRFGVIQAHLFAAAVRRRAVRTTLSAYVSLLGSSPMIVVKRFRVQRLRTTSAEDIDRLLIDQWPMNTKPSLGAVRQLCRRLVTPERSGA